MTRKSHKYPSKDQKWPLSERKIPTRLSCNYRNPAASLSPVIQDNPSIAPSLVPMRRLSTGALMPPIGLGTFGSDSVRGEVIAEGSLMQVAWARGACLANRRHAVGIPLGDKIVINRHQL